MSNTKRKTLLTALAVILSLILLTASLCTGLLLRANADSKIRKLLFVTEETADTSTLSAEFSENGDNTYFETAPLSEITAETLNAYVAVALPASETGMDAAALVDIDQTRTYLYGEVTIADYKAATGLEEFTLQIPMLDTDGTQISMAEQFFDETYEQTEVFAAICCGENALLGSAAENAPLGSYLALILDNCKQFLMPQTRATIIQSGFDYSTAMFGENYVRGVAHMSYTLYRNTDEEDPTYDYFAIKTNTWINCENGNVSALRTSYRWPNVMDRLMGSAPETQKNIGELSVGLEFGPDKNGKPNASVSFEFSIDLSDTKPNITREEVRHGGTDLGADQVSWDLTPRTLFPNYLNNTTSTCAATWANYENDEHYVAIEIRYSGQVKHGWVNEFTEESPIGNAYLLIHY